MSTYLIYACMYKTFLKDFFDADIFKVFKEFVTILPLFYVLVFWPWDLWDLSSLTRDQTRTVCIGRRSFNHWTTREGPVQDVLGLLGAKDLWLIRDLLFLHHLPTHLEKTVMLGKIEDKRWRRWQRISGLDSIMDSMDMSLSKLWETVEDRGAVSAAVHGVTVRYDLATEERHYSPAEAT